MDNLGEFVYAVCVQTLECTVTVCKCQLFLPHKKKTKKKKNMLSSVIENMSDFIIIPNLLHLKLCC